MKPISKTFKFSGGKTLKVREDGRYEWCGKLLGRDECVLLDGAILLSCNDSYAGARAREVIDVLLHWTWITTLDFSNIDSFVWFVRRYWEWKKGS